MRADPLSNEISIFERQKRPLDAALKGTVIFATALSLLVLIGIIGYVLYRGLPSINWSFLTTTPDYLEGTFGIAGNIVNTLYMVVITLLIATPIGIGGAIYLNEYAKRGKFVRLIEFTTETLAGIPSIIYGLFGMVFFGGVLKLGFSLVCGALTLSIMVLPIITRTTQEALRSVPFSYRSGALGIGATKWYMIRTIILPSAAPGIITGVILSIGRIVGESAALLFTGGNGDMLPTLSGGFLQGISGLAGHAMSSGGTLTIQLYLSMAKAEYGHAFGIAAVLLVIVLCINLLTKALTSRIGNKEKKR